ncbi:carboxymuconolactone decarboxylase family protein [Candidatus Fermentibacteria bacterium]|nr:carboxymuconolactone decarboxylase family protein [Candidatus Fermentibacteria bacterium]
MKADMSVPDEACCAHASAAPDIALGMFEDFFGAALAPGALDVTTKEFIAVALSLAVHCVPCARIHIRKAMSMGISAAELDEAAAIAVGFAGCRAMMLWRELRKELIEEAETES